MDVNVVPISSFYARRAHTVEQKDGKDHVKPTRGETRNETIL